ncbi:CGNR zinc finger domain-containing protein [Desertihabitans aurantiacus]|uniref:CGNR zinc finger domain-containing protein n=1 Tax=Desertihabitans aurantiacus TaxID=2282477 RepID=UPI000DF81BA7|nr:CGNR zinc finger domain-containing protein [Desertihabitans aurantiacus]
MEDEDALLRLLNSTPVVGGEQQDLLTDGDTATALARDLGGHGSAAEVAELSRVREVLQTAVRTGEVPAGLENVLAGVVRRPQLGPDGVRWELDVPAERVPAVRAVLAWSHLQEARPGRLRACGNDECRRFLVDRTRAGTARWCSMAVCGNRMKARRHHSRQRDAAAG